MRTLQSEREAAQEVKFEQWNKKRYRGATQGHELRSRPLNRKNVSFWLIIA